MSFVITRLQEALRHGIITKTIGVRSFSRGSSLFNEEAKVKTNEPQIDPAKDRRNPIPPETSIRYLASDAYKTTYGTEPVWKPYRRNHKGGFAPRKTRKTCIRGGIVSTSSPCPICRDEYLVFDHRNTALLKQFISEYNGEIISYSTTGICQKQHKNLLIALHRAHDYGTITFDVPFREYNYSDWYKPEDLKQEN
ncbi:28S ribosomal protein S18b, mitochondrial [Microplitis demolitor]|uniref:28S ribosomal protein S18b, mitochondrial n=1 Tax=Microplitis demolitor TaxID=69319 RepID=UPI0004CCC786|nr:28S ribosomal protein S18b, mitochondrial [Microplitis demolitor]